VTEKKAKIILSGDTKQTTIVLMIALNVFIVAFGWFIYVLVRFEGATTFGIIMILLFLLGMVLVCTLLARTVMSAIMFSSDMDDCDYVDLLTVGTETDALDRKDKYGMWNMYESGINGRYMSREWERIRNQRQIHVKGMGAHGRCGQAESEKAGFSLGIHAHARTLTAYASVVGVQRACDTEHTAGNAFRNAGIINDDCTRRIFSSAIIARKR